MVVNDIFSIFIIFLFVLFLTLAVTFYVDYRKHSSEVSKVYNSLTQIGLLTKEDYQLWEGLGFWGFGFRVTILSRLLRGRDVKLTNSRMLHSHSCHNILSDSELSWLYSYDKKNKIHGGCFYTAFSLGWY